MEFIVIIVPLSIPTKRRLWEKAHKCYGCLPR